MMVVIQDVNSMNRAQIQKIWTGGLICLLLLFSVPVFSAPNGDALYQEHCAVCHQSSGKGGIGLPLTREKLAYISDDYIYKTVRLGRPGRIMPAFKHLSDAQLKAIVGFIRSWNPEPGMVFSNEPVAGDKERGKALYLQYCSQCHGEDGSGEGQGTGVTLSRERKFMVMPAAINNSGFLQSAPDSMIKHTIKVGRASSSMPVFGKVLSDQQINDIVAFVRSFEDGESSNAAETEKPRAAYIVESPYDFETTVENVKAALKGANFRTFPLRFIEQGLIDEFSHNERQIAIRFCNFKELYGLLNIEPRLGTVLPCRIDVVEDKAGRVLLISANVASIAYWFNNDELIRLGKAMEAVIIEVMEEATL